MHKHFRVCQYKQRTRNSLADDNESIFSAFHRHCRRLLKDDLFRHPIDRWQEKKERKKMVKNKTIGRMIRDHFYQRLFLVSTNPSEIIVPKCTLRLP